MRALGAVLFVLVLALSSGAKAQQEVQTQSAITVEDTAVSDREIDERLEAIFNELDGLRGVFVTVRAGVVTLRGRVAEPAMAERAVALAGRIDGVVAVRNEIAEVTSIEERLVPVAERIQTRFWQMVGMIPLFLVAAIAWAIVFFGGLWLARRRWPWDKIAPNAFIADLLRQIIRLAFFVFGIVLALDILGATALLGTILGAAGIVGLAIGFAVRDTVENYIASILLSIRQPFRPKDFIGIEGYEGVVIRLTSRATILMDLSGNHIRIPNAAVFKGNIINYSRNPHRRFDFQLGVGTENDFAEALAIGLKTIRDQSFVLDEPGPNAWIESIGDSTVNLMFVAWIDQNTTSFSKAKSEAMRLTMKAFDDAGISMPVPIYQIQREPAQGGAKQAPQPMQTTTTDAATVNDTSADHTIEDRVDEERAIEDGKDLLSKNADTEL